MFRDWLQQGLVLLGKNLLFWLMYCVVLYPLLALGSLSQMLGIVVAVVCLFVGVGFAAYCDQAVGSVPVVRLSRIVKQCLPLAIIAGLAIMVCWFSFRVIADLVNGQFSNILHFFWQSDLLKVDLLSQPVQLLAAKIYAVSMVTMMFSVLMLTTFGSWFSFPLMVFNNHRWSMAKTVGNQGTRKCQKAMSNLMLCLGVIMVLGLGLMPVLTPIGYIMTSILMYVSYRQMFGLPF